MDYSFEEKGCAFLKAVHSRESIEKFNADVRDFIQTNKIYSLIQVRYDVQEKNFFVNNTFGALNSYHKMQYYYLPVVDNRGSHNRTNDVGMLDFYNIDKLIPNINNYFDISLIQAIIGKLTGINWKFSRVNLHISSNVENPQGYHYDSFEKTLKYTIYLSDVSNCDYGALSYIEKSHMMNESIKQKDVKIFTGNKGDVLISYQQGYHRKMPQKFQSSTGYLTFYFVEK